MSSRIPILRSAPARNLFLAAAATGIAMLFWIVHLRGTSDMAGLTPIYFVLVAFFDYPAAMLMLLVFIAALFLPARAWSLRFVEFLGTHPRTVAALTTLVTGVGALWAYRAHPLSMDEYAPYLQSQVFAAGQLTGEFPAPLLEWLTGTGIRNAFFAISADTGHVASLYWPGFALLLAPFTLLGIPWACNPVITGLSVLVIHRLALRLTGNSADAGLAVLFTIASPVMFADGVSYYSMAAHLLANALFVLLLLDATPRRLLLAGLVGSIALSLHNPLPHLLFALPWGIWLITRRDGMRAALWLVAGYLPLCLLLGVGWYWLIFDYMHRGPIDTAAFAATSGSRIGAAFSLPSGAVLIARVTGLAKIWLWSAPALLLLAVVGAWRHFNNVHVRLLALSGLLTLLGFCFVPFDQGHGWGNRYFHSAWFVLPLLAVFAFREADPTSRKIDTADMRAFAIHCAVIFLVVGVGQRAFQIREFMSDHLLQQPAYQGHEPRIVFLDPSRSFYGYDLLQNDPFLRSNRIMMLSRKPAENAALIARIKPDFHRVYADEWGEVYSAAKPVAAAQAPR